MSQRQKTASLNDRHKRRRIRPVQLILLIPFLALLWVPSYNRVDPTLFGIPFFYWYQMMWTFATAGVMVAVYLYEEGRRR